MHNIEDKIDEVEISQEELIELAKEEIRVHNAIADIERMSLSWKMGSTYDYDEMLTDKWAPESMKKRLKDKKSEPYYAIVHNSRAYGASMSEAITRAFDMHKSYKK